MLVIALTGGIGSGKTTVSEIFKAKKITDIDTDINTRKIVEKDKTEYYEIIKQFGEEILNKNKNLNRQYLRELIFSSTTKRLQLENILHPIIWNEVESQLSSISSNVSVTPPYCIVVVPLLLENSSKTRPITFDRILVIDVPEEMQLERSKKRDNSCEPIIKNIMKNQVSRQIRIDAADDIIVNTKDLDFLKNQIEERHNKYIKLTE